VPAVVLAALASLAGPVAYSAQTITTGHTGSTPTAGPESSGGGFGMGGGAGTRTAGARSGASTGTRGATAPGASGGAAGGQATASAALDRALSANAGHYRWVAATSGSQSAASLELATGGDPVMAIGGFSGEGGNLTLAQFKEYVARGEIHYYIASSGGMGGGRAFSAAGGSTTSGPGSPPGGSSSSTRPSGQPPTGARAGFGGAGGGVGGARGGPGGMSTSSNAITTWVKAHFKKVTVGGQTMYDLTQRVS
jgi:hypothetical protein